MSNYDLAIIGAGPGGYVAAIRASQLGLKTVLIEREEVGGVCLNWGCIPTKTIIASVNLYRSLKKAEALGVTLNGQAKIDHTKILDRKNNVVASLVKGIHQLIKGNKIDYLIGNASFTSDKNILVNGEKIDAKNIIIATGSVWKSIPGFERDKKLVLSSDDLLNLSEVPKSLLILGGGVVGCEFASIYNTLGTKVTIVEALENIVSTEDVITSRLLTRAFKKDGIEIMTGVKAEKLNKSEDHVELVLSDGGTVSADKILVSVGRKPNFEGLGIENIGVKTERGAIVTDEKMRTNVEGIYAIGDVNGKYMLAHTGSEEAVVAVENISGNSAVMDYDCIPRPVYTYPEVCGTGLTERELKERGIAYKTGKFGYVALSKAVVDDETEGQVAIYSEDGSGRVLGAQLIGHHATEIAAEVTLAIKSRLKVDDLIGTIHSHPTLTEVIKEAAEDTEERSIHKIYRKK